MIKCDLLIIGAGVVGLACAYSLRESFKNIIIIEKEDGPGKETSSRNTQQIHSGAYYQTGSLKHLLAIRGKNLLYPFLSKYNIDFKKTGKIFLGQENDEGIIEDLYKKSIDNGLNDVFLLNNIELKKIEPHLKGRCGLLSKSSGILNVHQYIQVLEKLCTDQNIIIGYNSKFMLSEHKRDRWESRIVTNSENFNVQSKFVINASGLNAITLSERVFGKNSRFKDLLIKGSWTRTTKKGLVNHIIYPAIKPGLIEERVDITPDLDGSLRFGPSVDGKQNLASINYKPPEDLIKKMLPKIAKILPNQNLNLSLDISGIRPKIIDRENMHPDFIFDYKQNGWLNLFGFESPALTASLAIGEYIDTNGTLLK